jgi:tRNA acetyltransferase TAN1
MDYNLIATTERINTSAASSQLWINLRAVGDPEPKVNRTKISGIIQAMTTIDPVEAVYSLREHMTKEPERYDKLFRILPIINWVPTSIDKIVDEVITQKSKVEKNETFGVVLEKRKTNLGRVELIEPIAAVFDNEVDLDNPDWVVLIEVMGNVTGVSIIKPEAIFNVQKELADLSSKTD